MAAERERLEFLNEPEREALLDLALGEPMVAEDDDHEAEDSGVSSFLDRFGAALGADGR